MRKQQIAARHSVTIRKDDQVRVMAGRDKGKTGRVLSVDPAKKRVTVEHAGMIKRHTRPNPSKNVKGGILDREGSHLHLKCDAALSGMQQARPRWPQFPFRRHESACVQALRNDFREVNFCRNQKDEGSMISRMRERYRGEVIPALMKRFSYTNPMAVPKLAKIVVNIGMGEASQNVKLLDVAVIELGQIAGQKPVVTRAKKSIANFKIRKGMPIGCCVTLRGDRMYEFLDRLCNIVLPRVRDFKGLPPNAFDGRGNYTLGLRDQLVFPEIDYTRVDKIKGMNITFHNHRPQRRRRPRTAARVGRSIAHFLGDLWPQLHGWRR